MTSICLIFDLDGTLVDSELLNNQALVDLLPDLGLSLSDMVRRYSGWKLSVVLDDLSRQTGRPLPANFEGEYRARVSSLFDSSLRATAGTASTLRSLDGPRCVASSAPGEKIVHALRAAGLGRHFREEHLFSSYDLGSWKPEPDIFLHAAGEMGFSPADCLVIEDSRAGLAPSAAAAQVLAADLGIGTENTAKWLHDHHAGAWNLHAGQLVVVDEASLAGTLTLDALTAHAAEVGAKVVLVGDWAQLAAIDSGGAFGMLVRERDDAPELTEVRRFHAEWEKTASLHLRLGQREAITAYATHDRLHDGDTDQMVEAAYQAWRDDLHQDRSSVLVAESREMVTELNTRARLDRITTGDVHPTGVRLHDGTRAGTGDLIVTRRNDRRLTAGRGWVKNGDRWEVLRHHDDGSLTVRRHGTKRAGTLTLPAAYVREDVELAYATTAHRAQGLTVDTAHVIVDNP